MLAAVPCPGAGLLYAAAFVRLLAMTPKEQVKAKHPLAIVVEEGWVLHPGAPEWVVLVDSRPVAAELGRGPNRKEAWADAAQKLPRA